MHGEVRINYFCGCKYVMQGMGTISGLKVAGYNACPSCGPSLRGRHSRKIRKMTYEGARCRLPMDHPMRKNVRHWRHEEMRPCPVGPSPEAQLLMAARVQEKLESPQNTGVNTRSCLWDLPYWRVRVLNCEYCELNVFQHVIWFQNVLKLVC